MSFNRLQREEVKDEAKGQAAIAVLEGERNTNKKFYKVEVDHMELCAKVENHIEGNERLTRDVAAATAIATEAHHGQADKAGRPYILHILRVARFMKTDREKVVAYLHDVIEDSDFLEGDLRPIFHYEDVRDVMALTKYNDESYRDYIDRLVTHGSYTALRVKASDLFDHLSNPDKGQFMNDSRRDQYESAKFKITGRIEQLEKEAEGIKNKAAQDEEMRRMTSPRYGA
jgi:(p)ppGpp synthase/HD superfamily hydrolase